MTYSKVCEAKTKKAMVAAFDQLCRRVAKEYGGKPEAYRATQLTNVGYFAGYYDNATRVRVQEWLGAAHPIFGSTTPTPAEAMVMGREQSNQESSK